MEEGVQEGSGAGTVAQDVLMEGEEEVRKKGDAELDEGRYESS